MDEKLTELYGLIAQMDDEEIVNMQHHLSARRKLLAKQKARMMNVGDKVIFESADGKPMSGKITKIMRTNIKVQVDGYGPLWTVHPSFITVVE